MVDIKTIVLKDNLEDILKLYEFATNKGFEFFSISFLRNNNMKQNPNLSDIFLKEFYAQNYPVELYFDMEKFEKNCDNYWVYYTGGQLTEGSSNRIIPTPSGRNRIIGLQMYAGDAKGFLHWGYNYYYGVLSHGLFNPVSNPCGYNQLAGTSYLVYPSITGEAIPSLRMKVFAEGLDDYRALKLLESKIGREKVLAFMEKTIGKVHYKFCPTNSQLFEFRQKLNDEIAKNA